jgi:hypothetical protein
MNYRRGFQRLYCLAALAWIVAVGFVYRWSAIPFTGADQDPPATLPADFFSRRNATKSNTGAPAASDGWVDVPPTGHSSQSGWSYKGPVDAQKQPGKATPTLEERLRHVQRIQQEKEYVDKFGPSTDSVLTDEDIAKHRSAPDEWEQYRRVPPAAPIASPAVQPESIFFRRTRGIGIALVPPVIVYLLLFEMLRWVYRGFRADRPASSANAP